MDLMACIDDGAEQVAVELGIDPAMAEQIAAGIKSRVRECFGGERAYVSSARGERQRMIARAVLNDSRRRVDVAKDYGVDRRTVDRAVTAELNRRAPSVGFAPSEWEL